MKTKILLLTLVLFAVAMTGCKKNDFDYPMESIHGSWTVTHVLTGAEWVSVSSVPSLAATIKFNPDNTYSGTGFFVTVLPGTYKTKGDTITAYVGGVEYAKIAVVSLDAKAAEFNVHMGGTVFGLRLVKS